MDRVDEGGTGVEVWAAPRLARLGGTGSSANGSSWKFQDSTTPDGNINFGTS